MGSFVLRSTFLGFVSTYFWSLLWIGAFYQFNSWIDSLRAVTNDRDFEAPMLFILFWASYGVMALIGLVMIWNMIYAPLIVHTFYKDGTKWWKRMTAVTYDFPFSKKQKEIFFDRVVNAQVEQASIDRILGTGSIKITTIAYTNGEAYESEHTIPGIRNPFEALEAILGSIPAHSGIDVRLHKPNPA